MSYQEIQKMILIGEDYWKNYNPCEFAEENCSKKHNISKEFLHECLDIYLENQLDKD